MSRDEPGQSHDACLPSPLGDFLQVTDQLYIFFLFSFSLFSFHEKINFRNLDAKHVNENAIFVFLLNEYDIEIFYRNAIGF